jgi:hypothetical protein
MRLFKDFNGISRRPAAAIFSGSRRVRRRRDALELEGLEDRLALSTFTVTNLADSGAGSLRQAIVESNSTPGPNVIHFARGLSGTIVLTSGELQITNNVKIVGPGANQLSVSGNNASRVFEVDSVQTAIRGLTITGGDSGSGGGIDNVGGTVTITVCRVSGNSADSGGGLSNLGGTMAITASTISGNSGDLATGGIG